MRTATKAAEAYLSEVEELLARASEAEREDIVSSVREHINTSLAQLDHPATPEDVEQVLRQLGPAEAVVASWADGQPYWRLAGDHNSGGLAWALTCIVAATLAVGALAVPLVGPIVQVALLALTLFGAHRAVRYRGWHLLAALVSGAALLWTIALMLFFYSASSGADNGETPTPTSVSSIQPVG